MPLPGLMGDVMLDQKQPVRCAARLDIITPTQWFSPA
jgi:hypothetical protein